MSGQAECAAQARDEELDVAGIERSALHTAEQRRALIERKRAEIDIAIDRLARQRQDRHEARLAAFAGDDQRVAANRMGRQAQSLGNAQAAAIEQGEHRGIAGDYPGRRLFAGECVCLDQFARGLGRQRLRHRMWDLRRAKHTQSGVAEDLAALEEAEISADSGKLAGKGAAAAALIATARQEGAEIGRGEACEIGKRRGTAQMVCKEGHELSDVATIGFDRMDGRTPLGREIGEPCRDRLGGVGCRMEKLEVGRFGHGRRLALKWLREH